MKAYSILVAGGGICGLATAKACLDRGFDVRVLEREKANRSPGAGIAVFPNGFRALRELGLEAAAREAGVPFRAFEMRTTKGKTVNRVEFPDLDAPRVFIRHSELHRILGESLPGSLLTRNVTVTGAERSEPGYRLSTSLGLLGADIVIGADGYRSAVRTSLLPKATPVYRGYVEWRGVVEGAAIPSDGATMVEFQGRGIRAALFPLKGGRVAWWVTTNEPAVSKRSQTDNKNYLLTQLKEWSPELLAVLETADASTILRTPIWDIVTPARWVWENLALVGDAAHAATPNLGQGACMALEDSVVLAEALRMGGPGALGDYSRARMPRTAKVTKVSRSLGAAGQWESTSMSWLRDMVARLVPAKRLFATSIQLQNYDPVRPNEEAS